MSALAPIACPLAFAALGGALALGHLAMLRLNVSAYLARRGSPLPVALHALRIAAIAGALAAVALTGALALLSAAAGFALARLAMVGAVSAGRSP